MKTISSRILVSWFVLFSLLQTRSAHAWTFNDSCNGIGYKWPSGFQEMRDACSLPDNSVWANAYWNGGWQWSRVYALMDWNWSYLPVSGCANGGTIQMGNGRNETARVPQSQLPSGAVGHTECSESLCFPWSTNPTISECDVKMADWISMANPDESGYDWKDSQGNMVQGLWGDGDLLHEFGHVLGMGHTTVTTAMMNPADPAPLSGGNWDHDEMWPDDAAGLRSLYGLNVSQTNLFASNMSYFGSSLPTWRNDETATLTRCPGQTFTFNVTVANNGTVDATNYNMILYMNNSPPTSGYGGGWTLQNLVANSPAVHAGSRGFWSQPFTVTVPRVPAGLYWIYWMVDLSNQYVEWQESDNVTHSDITINVPTGCP